MSCFPAGDPKIATETKESKNNGTFTSDFALKLCDTQILTVLACYVPSGNVT